MFFRVRKIWVTTPKQAAEKASMIVWYQGFSPSIQFT